MSKARKARKRRPADTGRIFRILTGPVYHDPLYRPFYGGGSHTIGPSWTEPVLQRRNPHKMPRNVAPLVCKISKDNDSHGV